MLADLETMDVQDALERMRKAEDCLYQALSGTNENIHRLACQAWLLLNGCKK